MARQHKYFVVTTVSDDGRNVKVRASILTPEEAKNQGYYHGYMQEGKRADKYVDGCYTLAEAKQMVADAKAENA